MGSNPKNLYVPIWPTTGILVFSGIFYPHGLAGCLRLFKKNKGIVSAVFELLCKEGALLFLNWGHYLKWRLSYHFLLPFSVLF